MVGVPDIYDYLSTMNTGVNLTNDWNYRMSATGLCSSRVCRSMVPCNTYTADVINDDMCSGNEQNHPRREVCPIGVICKKTFEQDTLYVRPSMVDDDVSQDHKFDPVVLSLLVILPTTLYEISKTITKTKYMW